MDALVTRRRACMVARGTSASSKDLLEIGLGLCGWAGPGVCWAMKTKNSRTVVPLANPGRSRGCAVEPRFDGGGTRSTCLCIAATP